MLFCSNYAKNYASTIRQGLRLRVNGRNNIQKCWELLVNTVASFCTQPKGDSKSRKESSDQTVVVVGSGSSRIDLNTPFLLRRMFIPCQLSSAYLLSEKRLCTAQFSGPAVTGSRCCGIPATFSLLLCLIT